MATKKSPKVAIVHDWLIGGGAERVVYELHTMYPDAPIYTSYCSDEWRKKLGNKVVTGYLQRWPFGKLRKFIPVLRAWWFSHLDLSGYDLVISSSGAEAKGIKTGESTLHVNYCHAPTHYYWSRYEEYLRHPGFGLFDPLARLGLRILLLPMRRWDFKAAQRPDYVIANSTHTQREIKKYYKRNSKVIHPPVDTQRFAEAAKNKDRYGFLIAGRQTQYKRVDLAVAACTKLGLPLTVIGDGPEHKKLRAQAGPTIVFLGHIPEREVVREFSKAEAFIFPGLDDFGIVAVEAMAAGLPVIAYKNGGALDYVTEGKTGMFFEKQTVVSLIKVLNDFSHANFNAAAIKNKPSKFSVETFRRNIELSLTQIIDKFPS